MHPLDVTSDLVRTVQFKRRRPGYDMEQVDQLLEEIAAALDSHRPLTAEDVRTWQFDRARFGYGMQETDEFLDRVVETMARREASPERSAPHVLEPQISDSDPRAGQRSELAPTGFKSWLRRLLG